MAGTLYIVATPIGNLDDMPPRVAATFGAADFIAAEDTRVTMKLLNFLGLKKPMVSYYEHALQKGEGILRRIEEGENCALCSDAGMPCVSDPGEVIVRDALARGIKVVPVPAASACVTALAVSGQDTSRWVFEGFLPVNKKQKRERLAELQGEKRTVIFYEAPHKLRTTLDDLTTAFGPERSITLCRELTKRYEQYLHGHLSDLQAALSEQGTRGEFVILVEGMTKTAEEANPENVDYAVNHIRDYYRGIEVSKPQGTYMLFLDCEDWCEENYKSLDELLKAGWDVGVAWQDGRPFHQEYGIRMNLALPLSRVKEAFERLDEYVFHV